jgi:carboxylate-amine ligase
MEDQPFMPTEDDYLVYTYNRFQACRFGMDAVYVDPGTGQHMPLREHIQLTLRQIEKHAAGFNSGAFLHMLQSSVERSENDARWLREKQAKEQLLPEVIRQASMRFRGALAHSQH